jgi:tetratricopeptide (TPR) repeat protein
MHVFRSLLATSAILALSTAACRSSEKKLTGEQKEKMIEIHTESAQQYLNMGELDRAEGQTLKGLELDPDNLKLKLIRGWALQKRGRTSDVLLAERVFREVLPSGDFRATLGLAEALERKGLAFEESARDIRSGKRVSESPDPERRADDLDAEARRAWTESAALYARTLEQHASDIDAMNGSLRVAALLGRNEESLDWSRRLIEAAQADRWFWEQRILRPQITADEEARFRQIVGQLADLEIATRVHASTILHELERDAEALEHVDAALALAPERAPLHGRRAVLLSSLGRYEEAIRDIDAFLARTTVGFDHPDIRRAYDLRGECERALRDGPTAESR